MPRLVWKWLVTSLAILMVPRLIAGVEVDGFATALAVAAILGLLNVLIRPLLILVTLPLTVLSLGFFILIINAFLFKFAGSFVSGFQVSSFSSAFLASLVVSIISWLLNLSVRRQEGKVRFEVHQANRQRIVDLNPDDHGKWK